MPRATNEPSFVGGLLHYLARWIGARPGARSAVLRALDRFPRLKRRLRALLSQARFQAAVDESRRRRRQSDFADLPVSTARVLRDIERERARLAATNSDRPR